jgi:hypothetical protein
MRGGAGVIAGNKHRGFGDDKNQSSAPLGPGLVEWNKEAKKFIPMGVVMGSVQEPPRLKIVARRRPSRGFE